MVCCSSNIKHTYQLAIARRGNVQSRFCGLWGEGWGQDRSVGVRTHRLPRDSGEIFLCKLVIFGIFGIFLWHWTRSTMRFWFGELGLVNPVFIFLSLGLLGSNWLQELASLDVTERGEGGFGSTGTNWPGCCEQKHLDSSSIYWHLKQRSLLTLSMVLMHSFTWWEVLWSNTITLMKQILSN